MKMGRPAWRREPELVFGATSSIVKLGWRTRQAPEIVASPRSRARRGKSSAPRVRPPVRPPSEEVRSAMQVVHERCCGLDVHKRTVVACVLTSSGREVRTFGTVTRELLRLADWLGEEQVSSVAMESTGVYWKPVYNLLEGQGIELLVVNAQHMKTLPGRKTDVKDSEWIADLLRHGLLRASFIPDRGQRELRELVRYRRRLIEQRADVVRRLQKVLEGANIKLGDVATDVMGVSGRAMLRALAEGQEDPAELAQLAKASMRRKKAELQLALEGSVGGHQRFMLRRQLKRGGVPGGRDQGHEHRDRGADAPF